MRTVEFRSRTSASAEALFARDADPDGLSKLTDPTDGVVIARSEGAMREGFEVTVAGWFVRAKFDDLFRRRHRKHAALAGGRVVEGHGA